MLYWLTSSSNSHASSLTSSDKEWIQQQIEEQESSGASREAAINELKAAGVDTSSMTVADNSQHASTVSFSYDMPTELKAGKVLTFVVNATWNDKKTDSVMRVARGKIYGRQRQVIRHVEST